MTNLRNFCDDHKIPYLLFKMKIKPNGKKDPTDGVIPGFQNITYEDSKKWNKIRMKRNDKPDTMNVILKHTRYMVIDIDDAKVKDEQLAKNGNDFMTLSTTKKLPHLWRLMHQQDNNDTRVAKKGYDLVYQNIFESMDATFENITDTVKVFDDWEIKSISSKEKKQKQAKHQVENYKSAPLSSQDNCKYKFLLDIIPTKELDYDQWMRVVFALHNINDNLRDVALNWSKTSPKYAEDPDEFDIVWKYCKDGDMMCNLGTLKTMAATFNKEEFMKWFSNYTNSSVNPDDLANAFLSEFGEENLAYTADKILYIFKNNNWYCDDDLSILKYTIRKQAQENFLKLIETVTDRMYKEPPSQADVLSKLLESYHKELANLKKKKIMDDTSAFITQYLSNKTTEANYELIVFDVNKEQLFNLHFKNGVYDLEAKEFRQREHSDYVSKKLDWEYNADVNKNILKEVEADFKILQPDKNEYWN